MPFDVAFSLDDVKLTAWSIICRELDSGKRYNFATKSYEGAS